MFYLQRFYVFAFAIVFLGCEASKESREPASAGTSHLSVVFHDQNKENELIRESRKKIDRQADQKKSCAEDNVASCLNHIRALDRKMMSQAQKLEKMNIQKKWCEKGFYSFCRGLSQSLFQYKNDFKEQHEAFFQFSESSCESGKWQGCELLRIYSSNVLQDAQKMEYATQKGCELGQVSMCASRALQMVDTKSEEFARLLNLVCEKDLDRCGSIMVAKPDYAYSEELISRYLGSCKEQLRHCEILARYAFRSGNDDLTLKVLRARCEARPQFCIELGIWEAQKGIESYQERMDSVCKIPEKKRRFDYRFKMFAKEFCRRGKMKGTAAKWVKYKAPRN